MALEPITLFSRAADPARVARLLRRLSPSVEFDGADDDWRRAVATFAQTDRRLSIVFNHDPDYHSEPNWSAQMGGMREYFAGFPETERKAIVMRLTTTLGFSLGTEFEPDVPADDDPRPALLFAVAEELDGVLFTPSSLLDARGRVLFSAEGTHAEDPAAEWPNGVA